MTQPILKTIRVPFQKYVLKLAAQRVGHFVAIEFPSSLRKKQILLLNMQTHEMSLKLGFGVGIDGVIIDKQWCDSFFELLKQFDASHDSITIVNIRAEDIMEEPTIQHGADSITRDFVINIPTLSKDRSYCSINRSGIPMLETIMRFAFDTLIPAPPTK